MNSITTFEEFKALCENKESEEARFCLGNYNRDELKEMEFLPEDRFKVDFARMTLNIESGNRFIFKNTDFRVGFLNITGERSACGRSKILIFENCTFTGTLKVFGIDKIVFENCQFDFDKIIEKCYCELDDSRMTMFKNCQFKSISEEKRNCFVIAAANKTECSLVLCVFEGFTKDEKVLFTCNNSTLNCTNSRFDNCDFISWFTPETQARFEQTKFNNSYRLVSNGAIVNLEDCEIIMNTKVSSFNFTHGCQSIAVFKNSRFVISTSQNISQIRDRGMVSFINSEIIVSNSEVPCIACFGSSRFISNGNKITLNSPSKFCVGRSNGIIAFIKTEVISTCPNKCICYIDASSKLTITDIKCVGEVEFPVKIDEHNPIKNGDLISKQCGHKVNEDSEFCERCFTKVIEKTRVNFDQCPVCVCCLENKPSVMFECGHICSCEECYKIICKQKTHNGNCPYCNLRSGSAIVLDHE